MSDKYDCANTVTFRSTPKTLGNIMTHLTGEQGVFDFNKQLMLLIPIMRQSSSPLHALS